MAAAKKRKRKSRQHKPEEWPRVEMTFPLGHLVDTPIIVSPHRPTTPEQLMALRANEDDDGELAVRHAFLSSRAWPQTSKASPSMTLAEFLEREVPHTHVHAQQPHDIEWARRKNAQRFGPWKTTGILTGIPAGILLASYPDAWWILLTVVVVATVIAAITPRVLLRLPTLAVGRSSAEAAGTTMQRFSRLPRPKPLPQLPEPDPAPSAHDRAEAVKADYGELLGDVIYRIEQSALFDPAVPTTREFQLLLLRWDDESPHLKGHDLESLARELELAFATAKRNADKLGLDHLPATARPDAERAVGSLRLAARTSSKAERRAALAAASRLLDTLALYYLPTPDEAPELVDNARRQLEAPR